ncbi:Myelin-associated oligodendrocyte basic protein isoform 1 [Gossypium australe]|uniref:Myelin-associated oligodendrocyte basic protein isoform 1 n=1 Tax=Gossypium australe TaxID=47621 RepID=A0A5B6VST7_9ROSI|nr:Myelin-associated oligodendrocyte basic protein isoform 1 [Gossypium australe]
MAATTSSLLQTDPLKLKQCLPLRLHPPIPSRFTKFTGNFTFQSQDFAKFNLRCFFSKRNHLTSSNFNTNHFNFTPDDKTKTTFEIIAETVLKALKALKRPVIAAVLLCLLLMYDPNSTALAASGGRMGGKSFSSRSYKVPSNGGSFSSYSVPYYAPATFGGGGGFYAGTSVGVGVGAGSGFMLIMIGFFAFVLVSGFLSDRSESGVLTDIERTSVLKLQVGLLGTGRSLQRDLNRIAEVADTSTSEGLGLTSLALLRHPHYCISGYSYMDVKRSMDEGEKCFNQLSIEERGKFDEETLVNVSNIRRLSTTFQKASGFNNEYIVITILVAAEGVHKLPLINGSGDLAVALQKLASIPTSKILAVEVLWTPQDENDTLSEREFLEDYPLLRPL